MATTVSLRLTGQLPGARFSGARVSGGSRAHWWDHPALGDAPAVSQHNHAPV